MAESPQEPQVHFVQQTAGPVFVGVGTGTLDCQCGHPLIAGYDPSRFLAIGIRCAGCGEVTTTPPLPAGAAPPFAVVIAEPVAEPRPATTTIPAIAFVIGRAEMNRLTALYRPATPPDNIYRISAALLDAVIATHDRYSEAPLTVEQADLGDAYHGLREQPLAWAVRHLRARIGHEDWRCLDDVPTSIAVVHVTGFLHFVATWSHHPRFRAMLAGVAARGFSMHGLAPFAAAHVLTSMGNRITFPAPSGYPEQVDRFNLATGPTETVAVEVDVFDRFEVPFGQSWTPAKLQAAVTARIAATQARINLRNQGLLLLSPGCALSGYDEALIEAVKQALAAEGRRNRGLLAAGVVVLRLQPTQDAHAVRLVYGLFPIENKQYQGDTRLSASN